MPDIWDEQIDELEAVDVHPTVFPLGDERGVRDVMEQAIRERVEVADREGDRGGADDGQGGCKSRRRPRAPGDERRTEERELAEDEGVVGILQTGQHADADREPEPARAKRHAVVRGQPLPYRHEQWDVPGVQTVDVVRRLGEQIGREPERQGTDAGPRVGGPLCPRDEVESGSRGQMPQQHADVEAGEQSEDLREQAEKSEQQLVRRRDRRPVGALRSTNVGQQLPAEGKEISRRHGLQITACADEVGVHGVEVGGWQAPRRHRPHVIGRAPGEDRDAENDHHDGEIPPPGGRVNGRRWRTRAGRCPGVGGVRL